MLESLQLSAIQRIIWDTATGVIKAKHYADHGRRLASYYYCYIIYDADFLFNEAEKIPTDKDNRRRRLFRIAYPNIRYSGKGSWDRFADHIGTAIGAIQREEIVQTNCDFNRNVVDALRKMIADNVNIGFALLRTGMTDNEAYTYEYHVIKCIDKINLTNINDSSNKIGDVCYGRNGAFYIILEDLLLWVDKLINNDPSLIHIQIKMSPPSRLSTGDGEFILSQLILY